MRIECPSRLHFGLWEICPGVVGAFGGIGTAVESPSLRIGIKTGGANAAHRPSSGEDVELTERIHLACQSYAKYQLDNSSLATTTDSNSFEIYSKVPLHNGLGSGTQIACSIASLLEYQSQLQMSAPDSPCPESLECGQLWARSIGRDWSDSSSKESHRSLSKLVERLSLAAARGKRSHVGLAVHLAGGFIVDPGHKGAGRVEMLEDIEPSELIRIEMPSEWKVILARPQKGKLVSGEAEKAYFDQCAVPNHLQRQMRELVFHNIVPSLQRISLTDLGTRCMSTVGWPVSCSLPCKVVYSGILSLNDWLHHFDRVACWPLGNQAGDLLCMESLTTTIRLRVARHF